MLQYNSIPCSYLEAQFRPDSNPKRGDQWVWLKKRVGRWLTFGVFLCPADADAGWAEWWCRKARRVWLKNHRIIKWFGLEVNIKIIYFLLCCHGQRHLLLDQVAQHPIQHELEHFQEWVRNLLALSSTLWPCGSCFLMREESSFGSARPLVVKGNISLASAVTENHV